MSIDLAGRRLRTAAAVLVALAATAAPTAVGSARSGSTARSSAPAVAPLESAGDVVDLLPLHTTERRIVDSAGRDVILRGANVNSLGEYWQGVPSIEPTIPVTDADWAAMAARGFSVVRLLITWSLVEPTRGTIDQAYLDEVDAQITAAASHGIYTVLDMHQDAYTAFLHTDDPATCPAGTQPAKGWDGAPAWAVLSDGLSTCTTGERNASPAVNRAWNNFFDDVDGIRTEFATMWAAVAKRFQGRAEIAGYDLLNEPENPRPAAQFQAVYDDFLADVIAAIRAAEADAPFRHLLIIEPALPAGDQSRGLVIPDPKAANVDTEGLVAGVHNYAESIGSLGSIESLNTAIESLTAGLGVPNWGGEYGFWDTSAATIAKAHRYAADEDAHRWGGAWWQWRQSCGDPHAVQWQGATVVAPNDVSTHLNRLQCPDNTDLGPTDEFLDVVGRGYARAAPGVIDQLRSDIDTGLMKVKATTSAKGGQLVVWTPTADDADHPINVYGLTDVVQHQVAGGRIITATVSAPGTYALWIGPVDEDLTPTTTTTTTPSGPAPATPVAGDADFTG